MQVSSPNSVPVPWAARAVAAVQVAGAVAAAVLTLAVPTGWLGRGLVETLAVAGVLGGAGVWRGDARGVRLSYWVQAVQVLRLQTAALTYHASTGPLLLLGVLDGQMAVTTGLGTGVVVARGPVPASYFGVNLAALLCLAVLWWVDDERFRTAEASPAPARA